ncbi:MAG: hypothetical protein HFP77_00340 [Methylococcales symbiont of Iophon sp. n. MRB-2018]|nr:MAG: hypothetical protein HFP77_00340 [Methylococcales symbiont of Iophon sp. n. MRB-2018]KAF3980767.1 MAG: hypothetical protein HFP76_00385 [Methylococcales symbiont of Iophon sp. n. MRB-2018]
MTWILYLIQQITLNERGLVALFGVDFVSMFYQQNDQEIDVILPNTAFFPMVFLIYCYKLDGYCIFKG